MKNYVASTTINFEGSKFYVRPGDMLTHDAQHGNSLAVYRNGQLVKVLKADSLIVEAFLKSKFITEVKKPAKPILNLGILTKEQMYRRLFRFCYFDHCSGSFIRITRLILVNLLLVHLLRCTDAAIRLNRVLRNLQRIA